MIGRIKDALKIIYYGIILTVAYALSLALLTVVFSVLVGIPVVLGCYATGLSPNIIMMVLGIPITVVLIGYSFLLQEREYSRWLAELDEPYPPLWVEDTEDENTESYEIPEG